MSDIGILPPGAAVWLAALAWCCLCLFAVVVFLFLAWRRARAGAAAFARDRFVGYAIGAWCSGMTAGLTISLINWSGSLGRLARELDRPALGLSWLAAMVLAAPVATMFWNRRRRQKGSA